MRSSGPQKPELLRHRGKDRRWLMSELATRPSSPDLIRRSSIQSFRHGKPALWHTGPPLHRAARRADPAAGGDG
jgi:hypothetical protein